MKRTFWRLGLVLAVLGTLAPAPRAGATGAPDFATGTMAFAGTAHLPTFPCEPPSPGEFPCSGTFTGRGFSALTGQTDGIPWAFQLQIATPQEMATFSYFDEVEPGVPCVEGFVRATGHLEAGPGAAFGVYYANIANDLIPTPLAINGAVIDFDFEWRHIGTTAAIRFNTLKVEVNVDTIATPVKVVDAGPTAVGGTPGTWPGYGVAALVPDPVQMSERMRACGGDDAFVGPLDATAAGNGVFHIVSPVEP